MSDPLGVADPTFGLDIGSLSGQIVDASVQDAVASVVAKVSKKAVEQAFTEDVIFAIEARAAEAAEAAVKAQLDGETNTEEVELVYGSVDEFFREYLRNAYRRRIDGKTRRWAGRWWECDEAVIRLEALWRSWEQLRQDAATGMSVWLRDHADHHMAILMDPEGPFVYLPAVEDGDENSNRKGDPLPYVPPPEGMFPDVREQQETPAPE